MLRHDISMFSVVGPLPADRGERPSGAAGGRSVERLEDGDPLAGCGEVVSGAGADGACPDHDDVGRVF